MSTILLSIGSNTFAKTNIDKAKRMLSYIFYDIHFSDPILSEPEDDKYKYLFRNILVSCQTDLSPQEVIVKIKQTERAVGRTPRDKYLGKVIIDIDLLKYNDKILRPEDYEREYIQQLIAIFEIPEPKVEEPASTESKESNVAEPKASDSNVVETSEITENLETAETEKTKLADSKTENTEASEASKTEKTKASESNTAGSETSETTDSSKETEELKSANSNTEDEETSEKE